MQPSRIKAEAVSLRKRGYSYNIIAEKLGVSKSSLSGWLKEIPYSPNNRVLQRIKAGPIKSAQRRHNQKVADILEIKSFAKKELGNLSKRDIWLVGIGLYIGEGSKLFESTRIINSDPQVIRLAVRWFKEICGLREENITIAIHIYPDNDIEKCIRYWSKTTGLSKGQFRKTQIDKRKGKSGKKHRKLPFGTAHLSIVAKQNKEAGVMLNRRIMGWIDSVYEQSS